MSLAVDKEQRLINQMNRALEIIDNQERKLRELFIETTKVDFHCGKSTSGMNNSLY